MSEKATPEGYASQLRTVNPGDWNRALDINHAFKIRTLKARILFTDKPPDFRSQLVNPPTKQHAAVTDFFNSQKAQDYDI